MGLIPNLNERLPAKPTSYSFDPLLIQCKPTENLSSADFFIISDFPTPIEVLENQPFIGPAGAQFNRLLSAVNLPRYKCYITHACKALIPNGIHDKLWTENGYRHPSWATLQERLLAELLAFNGKIVIVMGSTALQLLLDSPKINKISKYRGSVYKTDNFNHLSMLNKIVCLTLHPSSVLPQVNPINFYVILKDLKKFLLLNDDPSLLLPEPTLYIRPTLNDVLSWYEQCKAHKVVAFDIEATPKFITCFSLAFNESSSMSIPLMDNSGNYWTVEEEVQVWKGLAELLINPDIGLVCQNGMFDLMFILRTMGIISDNFYFDTMIAQHIVYTDLPKGLDFLTSAYTYYPYYKDEGKQSHLKIIKDWPQYWMYNAKDTAYLLAIMKGLQTELEAFNPGATDAMEYSMALHKPLMEMEWNGILTDQTAIKERKLILYKVIDKLQKALNRISGRELNTGSSKQMIDYFYNHLNLAPYMSKDKKATCDMVALSRIAKKKKPAIAPVVAKIAIKLRKLKKLTSTYFELRVDKDDHLRCGHKITGTNTGRIATAATFFGTGSNLQNQPPSFKRFLISDPDWLLCEVDLAKAEAHVVAFLCEDANMIHAFESGVDVHSFNASKIFNTPIESVTKFQRQLGKKVVHASNYGMGPGTFSNQLAAQDIFMSMSECNLLLDAYQVRFPGLNQWHKSIAEEIYNSRILYNLFNRPKRFFGLLNDNLLRSAYSYKPQSTVAELLNRGTIKIANDPRLGPDGFNIKLNTTVHDSDVFSIHRSQWKNLLEILMIVKSHLTHEFHHKGRKFTIGMDAKIGFQWAGATAGITDFTQESVDKAFKKINANLN